MPDENFQIPWAELEGGYRLPYDPRPALLAVEAGTGPWDELWEELHHQGDVGLASYAAIPLLADMVERAAVPDWNPFALAAIIDEARRDARNPGLPPWLAAQYERAWERLFAIAQNLLPAAADDNMISSLFAVLAIGKERPMLARMALLTEAERREMLNEVGWG